MRKKHYYRKKQRVSMCWGGRHDQKPPLTTPYSAIMCPIHFENGSVFHHQMRNAILPGSSMHCSAMSSDVEP